MRKRKGYYFESRLSVLESRLSVAKRLNVLSGLTSDQNRYKYFFRLGSKVYALETLYALLILLSSI